MFIYGFRTFILSKVRNWLVFPHLFFNNSKIPKIFFPVMLHTYKPEQTPCLLGNKADSDIYD